MKKMFAVLATTLVSASAMAQEAAPAAVQAATTGGHDKGLVALSAALAIGLAALGGALGQGKTASTALEGIARNPAASDKIFTPMIIGLALIESLVIYALVVALKLL